MDIIVGTAGHIDHGKTALVKALTGIETDRLPEEKERGITIDLGFAKLDLAGQNFGFIDVPGHEKFIKNMLAGASGIDLVLLVIASDEGVMPQTREHFDICRLLGIKQGIIVLTKRDLADDELFELVKIEVAEFVADSFLEDAPIVAFSAKTGVGIEELKEALRTTAAKIPVRASHLMTRLPIDRVFTKKGFGAVVTGTLVSGEIGIGDELELCPAGKPVRVRGVQSHSAAIEKAEAGRRTAINLAGVDYLELERGMALCETGASAPVQIFDAEIEVLASADRPIRSKQRIRVHIGTSETLARIHVLNSSGEIASGERDFVQVRLETPVSAVAHERFVLRQYSPQITFAGGEILDVFAYKHKTKDFRDTREFLRALREAHKDGDRAKTICFLVGARGEIGADFEELQRRTGWKKSIVKNAIGECVEDARLVETAGFYIAGEAFSALKVKILNAISAHHKSDKLSPGVLLETLRSQISAKNSTEIFKTALASLENSGEIIVSDGVVRDASHEQDLSDTETEVREMILANYKNAGLQVSALKDVLADSVSANELRAETAMRILSLLIASGELLKINDELFFSKESIDDLIKRLQSHKSAGGQNDIGVKDFKEIAEVSRKHAIPLLEYLDGRKITLRIGDRRKIL